VGSFVNSLYVNLKKLHSLTSSLLVVKAKLDFRRFLVPLLFTTYSGWGLGINISNLFCQ
jgi:hypothetical protein